jgi:hypothetical protein
MLGPIDYIAVSFKGNNFDGSILEELAKAVDSGDIRVVDVLLIVKNKDGEVALAEMQDQSEDLQQAAKALRLSGETPLLTEEDAEKLAAKMENDTSAGILVIEQLWAKGLKKALLDKGAELLAEGRIHPDKAEAAYEDVKNLK